MSQLDFALSLATPRLPTGIARRGNALLIPEGLHTVPATHGLHRFPGKFIPNLPRFLIREFLHADKSARVVDPFCGSGTTLLEAALDGRPFTGIDIDPLAVFLAKVKIFPLSANELESVQRFWKKHDYSKFSDAFIPTVPNLAHWFTPQAIRELASIKTASTTLPDRTRTFCLAVFSSIVRRVSNADDQTQKTYVSGTLKKTPPPPSVLFPIFLDRALASMREYSELLPTEPTGTVRVADARTDPGSDLGHVITSPPYIDSIDYVYNQMLEYFWLLPELGINSYKSLRALQKTPMGFRVNETALMDYPPAIAAAFRETGIERIVEDLNDVSRKEALAVRSFFADYATHITLAARRQAPGKLYITVVGNSTIRRRIVPTSEILVALHEAAGYQLTDRLSYEIRRHYMKFPRRDNSGTIKQDHILVFTRRA